MTNALSTNALGNVTQAGQAAQVTQLNQTAVQQQQQQQQQAQQSNQQAQQQQSQQANQQQNQTQQQAQQSQQQQLTTIPGTNIQIPTSVAAANGIISGNNIKLEASGILKTPPFLLHSI